MSAFRLSLLGLVAGTAVHAAGDALVIGNSQYDAIQTFFGSARVAESAKAFSDLGFDVTEIQDADADTMATAYLDFVLQLQEGDGPVVVVLAGAFVHAPGATYMLPVAGDGEPDDAVAMLDALPMDAVLAVLARYPGQAFLVLGETAVDPEVGRFLSPGVGDLQIPQGVTVLRGPATDVARFASRELVQEGQSLLEAAEQYELSVAGFTPRDLVVVAAPEAEAEPDSDTAAPAPDPQPEPEPEPEIDTAADETAWRLAQQADSAEGYRTYLDGFPEGLHAAAARQRLKAIEEEPYYAERRAEEAMELSRDARREIQRDLSILGYDTRGIDGIFGPGTRGAIRQWQETANEEPSSYLDSAQIARLDAQAARRAAELEEEARQRQEEQERADRAFWREVESSGDEASVRAYLERYPEGLFADRARELLRGIEQRRAQQAATQDRRQWARVEEVNTIEGYREYLEARPNGAFAAEAQARIRQLERQAEQAQNAGRARAEEQGLNLNPVAKRLAEARLAQLGLRPGNVDGTFDEQTRAAIRRYQETRGLRVSGFLDEQTVVRILADGILGD
ncbi:peptidoglycan-binding domain-containing protein [Pseudoponticoccus marisrubri]|uniref:Peptidoglycan-binding protein n=1 Tax=Pseudoponticoccus marisrubri TaxID=1685382 RepID=A0A0W7WQB2_9RHOB|nr:peptidoglycan-binding protein [Pseudoponticoccus marisrubri]KUF12752.1 hypothetical protein AVJ23_03315 [Pseudoponticoccus marisrubri]